MKETFETFSPEDPQYKTVEDLPEEERENFKNVPSGFVRKEAVQTENLAKLKARMATLGYMNSPDAHRAAGFRHDEDFDYKSRSHEVVLENEARAMEGRKESMLQQLRKGKIPSYGELRDVVDEFNNNEEFMTEAVLKRPDMFADASPRLQHERSFILSVIDEVPYLIRNDGYFSDDKEIVMKAIAAAPSVFPYASAELRNDEEVVLCALEHTTGDLSSAAGVLRYASPRLQKELGYIGQPEKEGGQEVA